MKLTRRWFDGSWLVTAGVALALMIVAGSSAFAAGEFYLSDEDAYWWYWDGRPDYEVLIPSSAYAYVQTDWSGRNSLRLALADGGPLLVIGTLPHTDARAAFDALSAPWKFSLGSSQITTNDQQITTDQGLAARFFVLQGRESQNSPSSIVRMVAFTREGQLAYLLFIGKESDYSGNYRQYWLRAVHSFRWR